MEAMSRLSESETFSGGGGGQEPWGHRHFLAVPGDRSRHQTRTINPIQRVMLRDVCAIHVAIGSQSYGKYKSFLKRGIAESSTIAAEMVLRCVCVVLTVDRLAASTRRHRRLAHTEALAAAAVAPAPPAAAVLVLQAWAAQWVTEFCVLLCAAG